MRIVILQKKRIVGVIEEDEKTEIICAGRYGRTII